VAKLTVAESLALIQKEREALDKREKALLSQNRSAALAQIVQIAKDNALSSADISSALKEIKDLKDLKPLKSKVKSGTSKKAFKPRGKVAAKYKNPIHPNQTWTGRGKMPAWVKVLSEQGELASALV
jgi:DNA-binding protein H-NS